MNLDLLPNCGTDVRITSAATPAYNCLAWALGYDDQVIWPDPDEQHRWPSNEIRSETVQAFGNFIIGLGYEVCTSFEDCHKFVYLLMYAVADEATHFARNVRGVIWESKLGALADITHHNTYSVNSDVNGTPKVFYRIASENWPPNLPEMHPPLARFRAIDGTRLF